MAKSISSITPQFKRDIDALAAYEPRARALRQLASGEIEAYIDWAMGDGYKAAFGKPKEHTGPSSRRKALFEPMPVDEALWRDRLNGIVPYEKQARPLAAALGKIELFEASAIEIALRLGTLESFESVLRAWSAPARRFAWGTSSTNNWMGWTSVFAQSLVLPGLRGFASKWSRFEHALLPLALLLGKIGHAEAMVRHGLCPHGDYAWNDLWRDTRALGELGEADLAAVVGAGGADVPRAMDWIAGKEVLAQAWESAFEGDGDDAAEALFGQGAPFDYYPLAKASERGDAGLLRRLFNEGADPNASYKTGDQMLCRLDAAKMTVEVLQAWLDAGARPILNIGEPNPFTSVDSGSSAIYGFAAAGRADLVKQACERAAEPFGLTYKEGRKTCAPLLAAALDGGHEDLARWLISEKGCLLSHLDGEGSRPCSEHASGDLLAAAMAVQEHGSLSDTPDAPSRRKPPL